MESQSKTNGMRTDKLRATAKEIELTNPKLLDQSPFAPVHPGRILREYTIPGHNLDVKTLAAKLNVNVQIIDDVVNERAPVTDELSEKLGNIFGGHKDFWRDFQRGYETELIDAPIRRRMQDAGIPFSMQELEQQRIVLMAFSFTQKGTEIGSVHVQKIMFLIDNEVDKEIGVPLFDHVQYKHGPNDHAINGVLNNLIDEKFMNISIPNNEWRKRKYILNDSGRSIGQKLVRVYPEKIRQQIKEIVDWAMELKWTTLKKQIYKKYPNMKPDEE